MFHMFSLIIQILIVQFNSHKLRIAREFKDQNKNHPSDIHNLIHHFLKNKGLNNTFTRARTANMFHLEKRLHIYIYIPSVFFLVSIHIPTQYGSE